jgi:hypothetical protein
MPGLWRAWQTLGSLDLGEQAKGPSNSKPDKSHPPGKPQRSAALKKMLGPPLHESSMTPSVAEVLAQSMGEGGALPSHGPSISTSSAVADSSPDAPVLPLVAECASSSGDTNATLCVARTWAGGRGAQCKSKRKAGDYCLRHKDNRPHGRVDEGVPPEKTKDFQKDFQRGRGGSRVQAASHTSTAASAAEGRAAGPAHGAASSSTAAPLSSTSAAHVLGFGGSSSSASSRSAGAATLPLVHQAASEATFLLLGDYRAAIRASIQSFNEEEEAKARRASLVDMHFIAEQKRLISERLAQCGREALDTEGLGNCQYLAVIQSAGLVKDHDELRQEVCDFIEAVPDEFSSFIEGNALSAYVLAMRRDCTWGDHLTLRVMAVLLGRPIRVVTSTSDPSWSRLILPGDEAPGAVWGEEIVVALHGERHYEATVRT